jgi:hypothetical protein
VSEVSEHVTREAKCDQLAFLSMTSLQTLVHAKIQRGDVPWLYKIQMERYLERSDEPNL